MFISKSKFLVSVILAVVLRCFFMFVPNRKYWVITERGKDARDNGYFFYKYMKDNHPEKKVYYAINKDSADYPKVKEDAIEPYGLKYYWIVFTCEIYISTHNNDIVRGLYKYRKLTGIYKKYCFLQHGVTKDYLPSLFGENLPARLFVCGAKPEYEYIRDNFGHPDGVVKYTGFARFDNLHYTNTKRQILVMPTWRKIYNAEFKESHYFRSWNEFLNDKTLEEILEKSNIDLIFYPHYEVQKYLNLFSVSSHKIKLASFKDYDVQPLLKESAVLITDFSSVYFDFAYMKKPVIYYQFDKEDFFKQHYQKGYFDYKTMGFGKVCDTCHELINEIDTIIKNNFCIDEFYLKRIENFFPLHDKNNCERIYNEIINDK